jgi:hypothetical protein
MKDTSELKPTSFTRSLWPAVLISTSLLAAAPAFANDEQEHHEGPPDSLADWQELYWRWAYGGITLPIDANGNAVEHGVVLMPIPNTSGDGTPGHQDVTLQPGQSWVLPLWTLLGTSYTDGTPPDPFVNVSLLATLNISFQIDGRTIVNNKNVMDFFAKGTFHPPVSLPAAFAPLSAIIWVEDIGVFHQPLSVGVHTMKLDVVNTQPDPPNFGGGFAEFHNTWTVTVLPENLGNPGIAPPDSKPYGKSYGEWSARHWQWLYSLPADRNPLLMDGNVDLSLGQESGPVWFLGGSFAPVPVAGGYLATANRTGTIPAGKALFFPILDAECSVAEGNGTTSAQLGACAISDIDPATGLACEIDGKSVQHLGHYRFESSLFTWGPLPNNSLFGDPVNFPAGTSSPAVSDGYFLMLDPLPPGPHTLHFAGGVPGFTLDITYHLTVKAGH